MLEVGMVLAVKAVQMEEDVMVVVLGPAEAALRLARHAPLFELSLLIKYAEYRGRGSGQRARSLCMGAQTHATWGSCSSNLETDSEVRY